MATLFLWTAPQSLEHAVTFSPWSDKLLVPSALSPVAYSYTAGASGLVGQPIATVAGMKGGFAGSVEDASQGVWLVGYNGDISYLGPTGTSQAYPIPTGSSGDIFVGAVVCDSFPYFVAYGGDIFTVEGSTVTPVSPGFGEMVSSVSSDQSHLYAVLPISANLATYTFSDQDSGSFTTSKVPMTNPAFVSAAPSNYIAVGGSSPSVIPQGAVAFQQSPFSPNIAAAVNATTNSVYLLLGPEPDWSINNTVSGTGTPVDLAWASSGEQVLTADTTHDLIGVFNLVAGVLVENQMLAVSGVTHIVATSDGMTAFAMQPDDNQVSVLTNTANTWAVSSTVSITGANSALGLSNTEFAIGALDQITWIQQANNGWVVTADVTGLAFTPNSLATDGAGIVFAAGDDGSTGYLVAVNQDEILATASWTGTSKAVAYDQAQIAVADAANSTIRVFAYEGGSLVQKSTTVAPAGVRALGSTEPSLWACSVSGMWQLVFTGPFELVSQPLGVFAIHSAASGWVSGSTGVLNQPTAGAWDVSGTVWIATGKDELIRYAPDVTQISGAIQLAPFGANNSVPIGISYMLWWQNGLFAVSSLNSSLMEVSGSAVSGVPGVPPGVLLGVNFILGESFWQ